MNLRGFMMETQLKIWIHKEKNKIILIACSLLFLFIFKNYLLDEVVFRNENKIINSYYKDGEKFTLAIKNNNKDAINIFLEKNEVDVNYIDSQSSTSLLIWALLYKNYDLSKELINRGADVNSINPENGLTALHIAASDGCEDCVHLLVSKGADVNAREKIKNYKPLDFAVENKRLKIINYLKKLTEK